MGGRGLPPTHGSTSPSTGSGCSFVWRFRPPPHPKPSPARARPLVSPATELVRTASRWSPRRSSVTWPEAASVAEPARTGGGGAPWRTAEEEEEEGVVVNSEENKNGKVT
jgi:hypothetical protein